MPPPLSALHCSALSLFPQVPEDLVPRLLALTPAQFVTLITPAPSSPAGPASAAPPPAASLPEPLAALRADTRLAPALATAAELLARFGHRCVREAELRVPDWAMRPEEPARQLLHALAARATAGGAAASPAVPATPSHQAPEVWTSRQVLSGQAEHRKSAKRLGNTTHQHHGLSRTANWLAALWG